MSNNKNVFMFGEGDLKDKQLLGGKGCGLGVMTKIGLPVPPGFTITSKTCIHYMINGTWIEGLDEEIRSSVIKLEKMTGKIFFDNNNNGNGNGNLLLLSVRSGAAVSMPGMMDTVLNLGLNDKSVIEFGKSTNNERFAYDSYRRFISMFGDVVMNVEHEHFEKILTSLKKKYNIKYDTDMTVDNLKELVSLYKDLIKKDTNGKMFPQNPWEQLKMSVNAVFKSWQNDRAVHYRTMNGIPHIMGTAVNIQSMVFGNMGDDSGTGVAFTRSPTDGDNKFYGEYLVNAQGEDVVAGIRTPEPIAIMEKRWPILYKQLSDAFHLLEKHYREMQDCEFTVEKGVLYMLQTRRGKRTASAALKIAVDMYNEGLMTREEAIMSIEPNQIDQLLHKQLDQKAKNNSKVIAKGLPASPGAAVGVAVFSALRAVEYKQDKNKPPTVLIRLETSPEDIRGMEVTQGILTGRGGMTSHAAVVARGMGRCCVSGCSELIFEEHNNNINECRIAGHLVREGDWITLDGATGEIILGKLPVVDPLLHGDYDKVMSWADDIRKGSLEIRTNADTPDDARKARNFGAQGIGLVRTEHMFFSSDRINTMQQMILSDTIEVRQKALSKLEQFQCSDFEGIFEEMSGLPVIIRLLDPPLHEFLPHEDNDIKEVSKLLNMSINDIKIKSESMKEQNPMLGFRGCRLAIVFPEIAEMQIRSIFKAAINCKNKVDKNGKNKNIIPLPEIEVPLVGTIKEYRPIAGMVHKIAKELKLKELGIKYKVGTMIEVPRAALTSDELALECDFMSFGTNDLTQMTCGFSRDDAGTFLGDYVKKGIYDVDPFVTIDQDGVGKLMKITVALSRSIKPDLDIGICGEHGGNPASVEFCHRIG